MWDHIIVRSVLFPVLEKQSKRVDILLKCLKHVFVVYSFVYCCSYIGVAGISARRDVGRQTGLRLGQRYRLSRPHYGTVHTF